MANVQKGNRLKGRRRVRFWNHARQRVLSFALIAFVLQATLPFLVTSCPLEHMGQPVTGSAVMAVHAMPADCPMMAAAQGDHSGGKSSTDPHKKHVAFCALCSALSPFNGYVAAGLIDLPPPAVRVQLALFSETVLIATASSTGSFSARAPPGIV